MERYLVFEGYEYYPSGGWHDFAGDFATIEEANKSFGKDSCWRWGHIVDTISGEIVRDTDNEDS